MASQSIERSFASFHRCWMQHCPHDRKSTRKSMADTDLRRGVVGGSITKGGSVMTKQTIGDERSHRSGACRRDVLMMAAGGALAATVPQQSLAQSPKRGGTLRLG